MTIERTELAVREYRAKTGEVLANFELLGAAMADAVARDDADTVARIKAFMWSKQVWRQQ